MYAISGLLYSRWRNKIWNLCNECWAETMDVIVSIISGVYRIDTDSTWLPMQNLTTTTNKNLWNEY